MRIKSKAPHSASSIKITPIQNDCISFSFKYYQNYSDKFQPRGCEPNYFLVLLERLKNICLMTSIDFKNNNSKTLRSHQIDWNDTTEPDGFSFLNEQLKDFANSHAFQFSLTANEHGRIHGFLIDDLFYIIWLDPLHKLYSQ